ncbi:DNA repair protein rada, partial [Globisporangium splendens]
MKASAGARWRALARAMGSSVGHGARSNSSAYTERYASLLCRAEPRLSLALSRSFATSSSSSSSGFCCSECGQSYVKWQGQCGTCNAWGSIAPAKSAAPLYRQSNAASFASSHKANKHHHHHGKPKSHSATWAGDHFHSDDDVAHKHAVVRMNEVESNVVTQRIALPERELVRVIDSGGRQSWRWQKHANPSFNCEQLALQIANMLAGDDEASESLEPGRDVLYVSGEESVLQVKMRAQRLGSVSNGLFVASETNIDTIIQMIERVENGVESAFAAVVIDSIQTIYAEDIPSAAGTVNQVKECTLRLLRLAKLRNVPVLLIGHVTKSGDIAGPKVLEHIVDTVVQLEGDPQSARRFLRCQKNRFGNTSEVGVFNMTDAGLQPLVNLLLAFVSSTADENGQNGYMNDEDEGDAMSLDGSSVTIAMEGSRPIPLEIQALANRSHFNVDGKGGASFSRVRGVGVSFDKLQLLLAVMEKRAKLSFHNQSVFVNVAEGYTIQEPAADMALAVALASSVTSRPVRKRSIFLGEIALSGHLRPVKMLESRLTAAAKIGVEVCVIPKVYCQDTRKALQKFDDTLTIIEATTVLQALKIALQAAEDDNDGDVDVEAK